MTRINTITPALLPTPWLVAEYRELPRILNRILAAPVPSVLPATYRMGEGHVSFFYDKAAWLAVRHVAIVQELKRRNPEGVYTIDMHNAYQIIKQLHPKQNGYWTPTVADHAVCLGRLAERWKGTTLEWQDFYRQVALHHGLTSTALINAFSSEV